MASKRGMSGTWMPANVSQSSRVIAILLVLCSIITSTVSARYHEIFSSIDACLDFRLRWLHGERTQYPTLLPGLL